MEFEVTSKNISQAIPRDSGHCMYADAIKDANPEASYISVDLQTIRMSIGDKRYTYFTPPKVQNGLVDFDQGIEIEPHSVRLPKPVQITQRGRRRSDKRAEILKSSAPGAVPTKIGGILPPMGPLAGGSIPGPSRNANRRTGRIRAFGLRGLDR